MLHFASSIARNTRNRGCKMKTLRYCLLLCLICPEFGCSSVTWHQFINVMICIKSADGSSIDWCLTCVPCPENIVYEKLKKACPYNADKDCRQLCTLYKKNTDNSYIADFAKTLNEYAECHVNTVEYKNVSITSTSTQRAVTLPKDTSSSTQPPTSTGTHRLSFGDKMLIVLCSAIIVLIVSALCRSGFRRSKETLKKQGQNEVEAQRMSVEITTMDGRSSRRMSISSTEGKRVAGCFPYYPPLKKPKKPRKKDSTQVEENVGQQTEEKGPSGNVSRYGENENLLPPLPSTPPPPPRPPPPAPPVQLHFHGNTNVIDPRGIDHSNMTLDDRLLYALSKSEDLPADLQQWINVFKQTDIREHICKTIDPAHLLDFMPHILTEEEEQWVKRIKEMEGSIRACKRLLEFMLLSKNLQWPSVLITALQEAGYTNQADLLKKAHEPGVGTTNCQEEVPFMLDRETNV